MFECNGDEHPNIDATKRFKVILEATSKASGESSAEQTTAFRLIGVVKFRLCNRTSHRGINCW